jgi:hypothetical protein
MQHLFEAMDQYPAIPICLGVALVVMALAARKRRLTNQAPAPKPSGAGLDDALFWWAPRHDPFRIRDLLNGGCLILGRAGSGKTSSSGRTLMQAIVDNRKSGGLILAAKPEDIKDVEMIFHKAGRLEDVIVFSDKTPWRCNFFGCLKRPRDVVTFLSSMSEVMKRGDSKLDFCRFFGPRRKCLFCQEL